MKSNTRKLFSIYKKLHITLLPVTLIVFSQCSLHELPEMEPYQGEFDMTIMEWLPTYTHLDGSNDFSMLIQALNLTEIDELLSDDGTYTLFAPGNIAWKLFLNDNGYSSLTDIPKNELRNILLYNLLDGGYLRENFTPSAEQYETMLEGNFITVNYVDITALGRYYDMIVNTRPVLTQNIQFNNGVIHSYGMTGVERGGNESNARLLTP